MNLSTRTLPLLCAAALLAAGCAGMRSVTSDVATYGDWPQARQPGSYAFERLPSQQAQADDTDRIEAAARSALEKAGFRPAAGGATPDVLVQVGARTTRSYDRVLWDDPLWWRGGFGSWRYAPYAGAGWYGPGWRYGLYGDRPRYDREVAVLLRDTGSGKPLFEAHASNDSGYGNDAVLLQAMFQAALLDFPRVGINPRRVVVALPQS